MAGVTFGLTGREVLGELTERKRRPIQSRNSSAADIGKNLPMGKVVAISGPGTDAPNTISDVMYLTSAGGRSGNGNNYFGNWCSGVYARDDGPYGSLVFSNGGDGDYWGNEVYKFALDTRRWSRECERSTGMNGINTSGGDPNFDETWGEHKTPGGNPPPQPGIPHSYDQMAYLPPHLGGGVKGSFMFCTRTIVYIHRAYHHPHVFDLNVKAWRRGSVTPGIVNMGGGVDSPSWCFDSKRNRYWGIAGGSSGIWNYSLRHLDFDPATGLAISGSTTVPRFLSPDSPVSGYWPSGDVMLVAGKSNGAFILLACPLAPISGFVPMTLTGANIPAVGGGYGFAYCHDLNCFFVRTASENRQKVWKLIPPASNYLTTAWEIQEIAMDGVQVAAKSNENGMWKRFMYVPPLKCLVWVDDIKGAVYAYRPVGT